VNHKKPRIAFISDAIYPYNTGGKEKRLYDIACLLSQEFDVHIYTMKWWSGKKTKQENGLTLHGICPKIPLYKKGKRSIKEAIIFSLSCLQLFKERFDLIEVDHMPYLPFFVVWIITKIKRKKLLVTWLEVWDKEYWLKYSKLLGPVGFITEKLLAKLSPTIISISHHTTQKLEKTLNRTKNIYTITPTIDLKKINAATPSQHKYDVIYAGRLLAHKNVDMLIHSIAEIKKRLPSISCLIVGEGPERTSLEQLSERLGLQKNVSFTNFFPTHTQLYSQMKGCKVFVNPSTREGFGIITIEANACGLPAVLINDPSNAARDLIVEGVNGYLARKTVDEMKKNLFKALDKKWSKNKIQDIAKKYDQESYTSKIMNLYQA